MPYFCSAVATARAAGAKPSDARFSDAGKRYQVPSGMLFAPVVHPSVRSAGAVIVPDWVSGTLTISTWLIAPDATSDSLIMPAYFDRPDAVSPMGDGNTPL